MGTAADYARGYADGFAGRNFSTIESASYEEGYTDGKAALEGGSSFTPQSALVSGSDVLSTSSGISATFNLAAGNVLFDPQGWIQDTEYESPDYWGETFDAGTTLLLPSGVYNFQFGVYWGANVDGDRDGSLYAVDNLLATGDNDPVLQNAIVAQTMSATALRTNGGGILTASGSLRVTDAQVQRVFAVQAYQNSGGPLDAHLYNLTIIRLTDHAS